MSYQDERQVRLRRERSKQAIALAMQSRWREAVTANKSIIENFPNDADAYNRLGKAYMELGEYLPAREAYNRAIEIDPYNTIAKKNLDRLSRLGEAQVGAEADSLRIEPKQFIEEAGKAGAVNLHRLAPAEVLARVVAGDRVYLKLDSPNLVVEDGHGQYLGQVEPKHGQRLIRLMEGGNKYTATIISSTEAAVTVIIREEYQHPSQSGSLSFPPKGTESFRPYVGDRIIRRELEYEEALPGETTYTIVGGDEPEFLSEESPDINDEVDNEEE